MKILFTKLSGDKAVYNSNKFTHIDTGVGFVDLNFDQHDYARLRCNVKAFWRSYELAMREELDYIEIVEEKEGE